MRIRKEITQMRFAYFTTGESYRVADLLQELSTALISAAVTGQIDVRKEIEG